MLARALSCAVVGLDGELVEVEVDIQPVHLRQMNVVGLPDAAVQESRDRVASAIRNSGLRSPMGRITVNLAPADLRKEGPVYDLAIAVGILAASEQCPADDGAVLLGELALDGSVRHVQGILAMVGLAARRGIRRAYLPASDGAEAALLEEVEVYPVSSLAELVDHLTGAKRVEPRPPTRVEPERDPVGAIDFRDIKGQEHVKRGLEIAATGGHNLLMTGPPGAGKTLLARALPSILPAMSSTECLEVTRIYSVAGMLPSEQPLMRLRPFRAPHHTVSNAGLIGGGSQPRPGEITLSHRGVLFLDELPEFGQQVLEMLRQPLEDRIVTISRARGSTTFPANFMLITAMNPCPCGYYGDPSRNCSCTYNAVSRYQKRISGPLLDRIDMFVEVPRVDYDHLADERRGEASAEVRRRVERARLVQERRFTGTTLRTNAEMTAVEVRLHCQQQLEPEARASLRAAMDKYALSARGFHRVLKLARTIADLAGSERMTAAHVLEAVNYRQRAEAG